MSRQAAQRLLSLLTLAFALALPLRAFAAIVPACEEDAMSIVPVAAPGEPSCEGVGADDAPGAANAAPICDPRGASAVAPPRILPVADARIEAAPGCASSEVAPRVGPSPRDPTSSVELAGPPSHAVLALDVPVLPPPPALTLPDVPVSGGPHAGVSPGVYHPPR